MCSHTRMYVLLVTSNRVCSVNSLAELSSLAKVCMSSELAL
jgi:threonine aldolase